MFRHITKMSWNSVLALLLVFAPFGNAQPLFPRGGDGWTQPTLSAEGLVFYVSSSDGNDKTGIGYTVNDLNNDPQLRNTTSIKAFKTFKAAYNSARANKPDWILIKKGDTFYESVSVKNGLSTDKPFFVSTYGQSNKNPIFKTGKQGAVQICCKSFSNIIIQGIDFYAHTRDPNSSDYVSSEGSNGLNVYVRKESVGESLLLEGNRFYFYRSNSIQGEGTLKNIELRRNSFFDNYSTTSHSQGLFVSNASVKLEENIFDHNGWYRKADEQHGKKQGAATMYNHNTYFADTKNVVLKGNIFARSSSMQNKWTANNGKHSSSNSVIKNNIYIGGEIGISITGNQSGKNRFKNYTIEGNVLWNIGEAPPTGRELAWGIEIKNLDTGLINNNYFLHHLKRKNSNSFAIKFDDQNKNVIVKNNLFSKLYQSNTLILNSIAEDITITENKFVSYDRREDFYSISEPINTYKFANNSYYSISDGKKHFVYPNNRNTGLQTTFNDIFNVNPINSTFKQWLSLTKEKGSMYLKPNSLQSLPSLESYLSLQGEYPSLESFVEKIRSMTINNWDERFTSKSIVSYFDSIYSEQVDLVK